MAKIILVGKAGSGKDYLRKKFQKKDFLFAPSYTTRVPREGEVDGIDYIFISKKDFKEMAEKGEFIYYMSHDNEYYGTTFDQWELYDLFISSPSVLKEIDSSYLKDAFIIYRDIDKEVSKKRMEEREFPADKVTRRLKADERDFRSFDIYDIKINGNIN